MILSSFLILLSIAISYIKGDVADKVKHRLTFYAGISCGTPVIVLLIMGRENVYHYMERRLESTFRDELGDLCTKLMVGTTSESRKVGYPFHVKKGKGDDIVWVEGKIKKVDRYDDSKLVTFHVEYEWEGKKSTEEFKEEIIELTELKKKAREKLRYVDWGDIVILMKDKGDKEVGKILFHTGSQREKKHDPELYKLSKSLVENMEGGEKIDFFISHAWNDDKVEYEDKHTDSVKFEKLKKVMQNFFKENQRYPTIWLDKLCVPGQRDGEGMHDSLKTLPTTVQYCDNMIVLLGESYLSRLWCIWELCTLLSFALLSGEGRQAERDEKKMLDRIVSRRIKLIDLHDSNGIEKLQNFKLQECECFDKNEEEKLRLLIKEFGQRELEEVIQKVAKSWKDDDGNDRNSILSRQSSFMSLRI